MHDIHKYRWDIHSVYDEAIEFNHDDEHSKHNKNDEIKALSSEHIYR